MMLSRQEFQAIQIFDIAEDPQSPELIWSDGQRGGHDAMFVENLLFDFHGSLGTIIYDITIPNDPFILSIVNPSSDITSFHHSGWVTQDLDYLIINDERSNRPGFNLLPDVSIWDIADIQNPSLIHTYNDSIGTVHNVQTENRTAYFSYYSSGFVSMDLSKVDNITIKKTFDTTPEVSGKGIFEGAFGIYISSF